MSTYGTESIKDVVRRNELYQIGEQLRIEGMPQSRIDAIAIWNRLSPIDALYIIDVWRYADSMIRQPLPGATYAARFEETTDAYGKRRLRRID